MGRGDFLKLSSPFFEHGLPRPQNTDKLHAVAESLPGLLEREISLLLAHNPL
jgi:hypothetical protein